jgi:uncharacterized protein YggE
MKKKLWLTICSVLIIFALGVTGCESITSPTPRTTSSSGLITSQQNTGIWVNGEGKVTVVPDVAILSLGVEAQAATVAQAQSEASTAMAAVVSELKAGGVAEKDIKTQHFSIYPVRRWVPDKEEEVLIGYRVNNMITAKVREVENTGTIIDAVARAGGDNIRIDNIGFTVDDPAPYYKEARAKAMADAKDKAEQLADSARVKLGEPTYINESGGFIPVSIERIAFAEEATVSAAASTPSISPGETEIQLNVQVVYSIS